MKHTAQVNRRKKESFVVETIGYQGICPSCENLPLCTFIHGSRMPVTFCEEFTNNGIPKAAKAGKRQKIVTGSQAPSERFIGLCITCENRNGCCFSKDEAGIWRCEEYR